MSKFFVRYELPYTHIVVVGVEADDAEAARARTQELFDSGELWTDSKDEGTDWKLLHDTFEENGESSVLEFKAHPCDSDEFPETNGPLPMFEYRCEDGVPFDSPDWEGES